MKTLTYCCGIILYIKSNHDTSLKREVPVKRITIIIILAAIIMLTPVLAAADDMLSVKFGQRTDYKQYHGGTK